MQNRFRRSILVAIVLMAAGSANQAQAIFDASKTCPAVAPGDHEAYHLPVATGLLPNVTFSTDWSQIPATGDWYGQQIMDNCRIKADGNVTWHGKAAARVEVQPGDDPLALGANSERAEMPIMQTATGVQINETTATGTQYYATSYYFPSTWAVEQLPWSAFAPIDCSTGTQNQCNSWSAVFQFHGASSAVWGSLMAARTTLSGVEHYAFNGHNFTTNGNITPDKWTDFVFQINWSTGAYIVYRRDQGSVAFTQVLAGTTPRSPKPSTSNRGFIAAVPSTAAPMSTGWVRLRAARLLPPLNWKRLARITAQRGKPRTPTTSTVTARATSFGVTPAATWQSGS